MRNWIALSVLVLFTAVVGHAAPTSQSSSILLTPQNALGGACPMTSSDGGLTTRYSTAAAENFTFPFTDPLPADVVLDYLEVTVSLLGPCEYNNSLQVRLNPTIPGIDPAFSRLTPNLRPISSMTSCSTPASFQRVSAISQPVLAPAVTPYLRGQANVLNVVEVPAGACGDLLIEFIDVTFHYWVNVPRIDFEVTDATPEEHRRILMHRYRSDYDYLSPWQAAIPLTNPDPYRPDLDRDARVLIRGTMSNPDGTPAAGETVYLRPHDPPDPSPYIPPGASREWDNPYGTSGFVLPISNDLAHWQSTTTDANGRFEAILPVAFRYAGDNVLAEASAIALPLWRYTRGVCKTADGCYRSGTFTAWRRVYLEADRMFREGAFISRNVAAGATEIEVDTGRPWRGARAHNPIPITLIHTPGPGTGLPAGQFYMEQRNVIRVRGARLTLDAPVGRAYFTADSWVDGRELAGDAVGRTDRGTFTLQMTAAVNLFKAAFVDYQILPELTKNMMPYVPAIADCPSMEYCTEIASIWFENREGDFARSNHQHLIAANFNVEGEYGHAVLDQFEARGNAAFVWVGHLETAISDPNNVLYNGLDLDNVIAETTAHELVHLYDVNPPGVASDTAGVHTTGGHCTFEAWNGGTCLMNLGRSRAERGDGIVSLHVQPGIINCDGICPGTMEPFGDSELRRIRYRRDPLPEFFQTNRNSP